MSPLLFNSAADYLAKMVQTTQQNGIIKGLVPKYIPNGVAILQYDDDTILCMEEDPKTARNMKILLHIYEKMSGLKINFDKSKVIMNSMDGEKSSMYANMFNCAIGQWPIKYLGVPVAGSRLLYMQGELILIDACLSNIPTYAMSMYLIPKAVIKKIDGARKKFFWQGVGVKKKYHLVKWVVIAKPKKRKYGD